MRFTLLCLSVVLLSGCASSKLLENRLACSMDRSELYVVSKYGPIGISTEIAKADAAVVCK